METPMKRAENVEKRGGGGKKSGLSTVHGAPKENLDPRLILKKLAADDALLYHGKPARTPTTEKIALSIAGCTQNTGIVAKDLGRQNCGVEMDAKGGTSSGQGEAGQENPSNGYGRLFTTDKGNGRVQVRTSMADPGSQKGTGNGTSGVWMERGIRNEIQQGRTFASLLNSNPMDRKMKLSFVEPGMNEGQPAFFPLEEVIVEARKKWEDYIVGYFISGTLPTSSVERAAKGYWGKLGLGKVLAESSGFYFFEIPDEGARRKILEEGPWLFYGRNIVLQQWNPELILCKQTHDKIPLWVRFRRVPLTLWTEGGLSGIASLVGKPLYADSFTENMTKIDFARICVQIDATKPLPESVQVCMAGEVINIPVEYQWKPMRCSKCEMFGHVCRSEQAGTIAVEEKRTVQEGKEPTAVEERMIDNEGFVMVQKRKNSRAVPDGGNSVRTESYDSISEVGRELENEINPVLNMGQDTTNHVTLEETVLERTVGNEASQEYNKNLQKEGSTAALGRPVMSNSDSFDSEDSDTAEESSEGSISNVLQAKRKQRRSVGADAAIGKQYGNKEESQVRRDAQAQKEATLGKVVAAMPNNQFQEELHKTNLKKSKKDQGIPRHLSLGKGDLSETTK